MKGLRFTVIVLMTLLCLSCKNFSKQEQSKEAIGKALQTPPSWQEKAAEKTTPAAIWLAGFDDPLLLALIKEAHANNIDLKVSAKNIEKAWIFAAQAGVQLKPQVDLSVGRTQLGFSRDSYNKSTSYLETGLSSKLEIDVWGRIREGVEAAKMDVQMAEADYVFAQHSLSASIAKTYLKIIESKQQTIISNRNRDILEETLRITLAKKENGLGTGQDIALSSANLAAVEDHLLDLKGAERDAVRALELLLGRYPGASLEVADLLPSLPLPPAAGVPSELLERRPDIIAAERAVAAAFNRSAQAQAAFLPRFVINNQIAAGAHSISDLFNPGIFAWKLAGALLTPVFDGGRRKFNKQLANVEQQQAVLNYSQLALNAFYEVEGNLYQGQVLAGREITLEEVSRQSAKAYQISEIRYKEGEIDLLDTLTIQREAIMAESTLLSVKRAQLDQQIDLYLSLGGSW